MMHQISLGLMLASLPLLLGIAAPDCHGEDPTPTPPPDPTVDPGACIVTGCSGQVCASEDVVTTCEWTCEYGCYQYAVCEVQSSVNQCGWTSTPEFESCMKSCSIGQ